MLKQLGEQAVRGSTLEPLANYGGSSPTSAQGMQGAGLGSIRTPRQLVAELNKHVVGQEHAKKVGPLPPWSAPLAGSAPVLSPSGGVGDLSAVCCCTLAGRA